MADQSGVSNQIISLPKGGGAQHGLGEKFSADLHTGTGNFTVPLALPAGRNGFQPQLTLGYSTGQGNSPFGLGWNLSIPGISRRTAKGVPRYDDGRDVFILSGAEDLVPVTGAYPGRVQYRPRTEGLFARIEHVRTVDANYWEVKSKDGLTSYYGQTLLAPARYASPWQPTGEIPLLTNPADITRIFAWRLASTQDAFGNRIEYVYDLDQTDALDEANHHHSRQPLLKQIRYADYADEHDQLRFLFTVTLDYEDRPDPFSDYRAGFEIRTTQRCGSITMAAHTFEAQVERILPIRTYTLAYEQAPANGASLLKHIQVVGYDDAGVALRELPTLEFGYSTFEPAKRQFKPLTGAELPAVSLAST